MAPPRVVAAFADQDAAVSGEVPNQLTPFHGSDGDEFLGKIILGGFAGFFAVEGEGFFQDGA